MATKITYTQQGDYLLPDLKLPEQPTVKIGIWGSCKLTAYLADIDAQAEDMFFRLVNQLAKQEGVTEKLKADNQILWVRKMDNIRNRATEIINDELIYT